MLLLWGQSESVKPHDPENMYRTALETLDDEKTAKISGVLPLLEESAAQGHAQSIILLLDIYEGHRKGIDAQPIKAAKIAQMVATEELKLNPQFPDSKKIRQECMFRYALFCERGSGCPKDERAAFKWMYKAARERVDKAQVELARYVMLGIGTRKAPKEALKILRAQALTHPDTPNLFFYLGYLYQKGIGTRHADMENAFICYTLGFEHNDARAINNLAGMYELGIGVNKNQAHALKLYKKAAALGNKDASANMQRLAYLKAEEADVTTNLQKICGAAVKVILKMPFSDQIRTKLTKPLRLEIDRQPQPEADETVDPNNP